MMFISKFNALIRNRIFWGAFAFLVVISFVGWGTQDVGERNETQEVGKLPDGMVRAEEFQEAWFNAYLSTSLMFGRPMTMNARTEEAMKKLAWRRLAAVRQAYAAGLRVTDDEVASVIQQQPQFQTEGRFDPARYQAFIQNFMAGMRVSPAQFERYLAQEIMLNKARQMIAPLAWVPPAEVDQVFHQLYDDIAIGYAVLNRANLNYAVDVSEDEAREYFAAHRQDFEIPERVRVKYVAIPVAADPAAATLDDAALKSYYDENIEEFTVKDTNEWLNAEPFESVRDRIRAKLVREQAEQLAGDQAAALEETLAPDRRGNAPTFEAAAQAMDLPVRVTELFAKTDPPAVPGAGADFNRLAFELRPTPEDYFSHPVRGDGAFYILAFDAREDARLPEFDEVRAEVMAAAREQALADELQRLAAEIHAAASDALAAGRPLAPVFADYGLEFTVTEPFSLQSGLEGVVEDEDENFKMLLRDVMACRTGELTGLVRTTDGYAIGFLANRVPADAVLLASIRPELTNYLRKRRDEAVFNEWQNDLFARAKIENLKPRVELDEEEADAEADAYDYGDDAD